MRITPHRLLSGPPHRRIPGPALSRLEQLMDALRAGVILIDPTGVILSVNQAALGMHGVDRIEDLGITVDDYGQRFSLRDSNNHQLTRREYPLMRLLAGESLPDLIVKVTPFGQDEPRWVHQVRDVATTLRSVSRRCFKPILHRR
jgi:PAS domain-containing protein